MLSADELARLGRSAFGENWKNPLARAVGVDPSTIRRWLKRGGVSGPKEIAVRAVVERAGMNVAPGRSKEYEISTLTGRVMMAADSEAKKAEGGVSAQGQGQGRGGNPNDPELKAQRKQVAQQMEQLEDQIDAAGEGEDTSALEQQLEQLEQQHAQIQQSMKDARRANLDARKQARKGA